MEQAPPELDYACFSFADGSSGTLQGVCHDSLQVIRDIFKLFPQKSDSGT